MSQIPQWRAANGQTVGVDLTTGDLDVSAGGSFGGALDVGGALTAGSVAATGAVSGASVSASGALSGATLAVSGAATLTPLTDALVRATLTATGGTGGATAGTLTMTLTRQDGSAVASAREVNIVANPTAYRTGADDDSITFSAATVGTIVASGDGWALVRTNAAGAFACTVSNADDDTTHLSARTALAGVSSLTYACSVVGSNSDSAEWTGP